MGISVSFDEQFHGNVDLRERSENALETKEFGYTSSKLVETEEEQMRFAISYDEDVFRFSLRASHVANNNTLRVFHSSMETRLTRAEMMRVKNGIDFILAASAADMSEAE